MVNAPELVPQGNLETVVKPEPALVRPIVVKVDFGKKLTDYLIRVDEKQFLRAADGQLYPLREFKDLTAKQIAENEALLSSENIEKRLVYWPWRQEGVGCLAHNGLFKLIEARQNGIYSPEQLEFLANKKVLLIGGSTGSVAAEVMVREGIGVGPKGEMIIADGDWMSTSNLVRTTATLAEVEDNKALLTARRLVEIFPEMNMYAINRFLDINDIRKLAERVDCVVEACDNWVIKLATRLACCEQGKDCWMATNLKSTQGDVVVIDHEPYGSQPDYPLWHGRLNGLLPDITWDFLTDINPNDKLDKRRAVVILQGVGLVNIPLDLMQAFLDPKVVGIPQTMTNTTASSSLLVSAMRNQWLGNEFLPRMVIDNRQYLMPEAGYRELRRQELREIFSIASQLGLPTDELREYGKKYDLSLSSSA